MTFKRHHHEHFLTEAEYDFLLPVSDPITILPSLLSSKQNKGTRSITKGTQTGTAYRTPPSLAELFAVLELAEKILLQLPPENLLCKVQRVCRQWHTILEESDLIREYLFFKPIKSELCHRMMKVAGAPPLSDNTPAQHSEFRGTPLWKIENPWLYLFSASPPRSPGSWQRMLVTQPPTFDLRYSTPKDFTDLLRRGEDVRERYMDHELENKYQREWLCEEGNEGMNLGQLDGLYIAAHWGAAWKPMVDWETIRSMKKVIRFYEDFLELEIAREVELGLE